MINVEIGIYKALKMIISYNKTILISIFLSLFIVCKKMIKNFVHILYASLESL